MPLNPAKTITLVIGKPIPVVTDAMPLTQKQPPQRRQTHLLHHHEMVLDILKYQRLVTDGSLVVRKPGEDPYHLSDCPYEDVVDGGILEIVPDEPAAAEAPLAQDQEAVQEMANE